MLLHEDHRKSVVYALAFSPDGATLASGARDGSLLLRDTNGKVQQLCEPGVKTPAIHAIAHLPDCGGVVIGHALGWYVYWYVHGRDAAMQAPPTAAPTTSLAMLSDTILAVGTGDRVKPSAGTFELWDLASGRRREPFFQELNGVRAVAVCPTKKLVAWSTGHKKAKVWDITQQRPIEFTLTHNSPSLALSPDGTLLATPLDYNIKLYDIARKQERRVLKGHRGQVTSVAFSPDGKTVATGSWDLTVRLWDVATGQERANYQWPIGRVTSLAFAPDGFRIAAGGDMGAVVVWDVD